MEQYYSLKGDELDFFRSQTGIEDEEELKQHIIAVQKKAYDVWIELILCMKTSR